MRVAGTFPLLLKMHLNLQLVPSHVFAVYFTKRSSKQGNSTFILSVSRHDIHTVNMMRQVL